MLKIGVLDLQGGVREHIKLLQQISDVIPQAVKKKADFQDLDGLILPGGESTTINKLLNIFNLKEEIINLAQQGTPMWGTCAGMILLAKRIENSPTNNLNLMDITVKRNAYGNQLASFKTKEIIPTISSKELPLVFIRAPYIVNTGEEVDTLLELEGRIVAAEEDNLLATAFHPELTSDLTLHNYFVDKVRAS
ncbi:MAG: pyridoxal 5'-phosphate synthase glutaminase subunit PdxT [Halanaerobacter sp.]